MRVQVVSAEMFATEAADMIEKHASIRESSRICFPAGQTPMGIYTELVRRYRTNELNLGNVEAFTLDEYAGIARDHPRACFQSLKQNLYNALEWSDHQLVTYDDTLPPIESANTYERLVMDGGGLDLSILGIGLNGHVGFNEPGTPFDSRTHVSKLAEMTLQRADAKGWADAPKSGLTLGIGTLMESTEVLLIANGRHKADIISKIVHGPIAEDVPASVFWEHSNCLLLLDDDAASLL